MKYFLFIQTAATELSMQQLIAIYCSVHKTLLSKGLF